MFETKDHKTARRAALGHERSYAKMHVDNLFKDLDAGRITDERALTRFASVANEVLRVAAKTINNQRDELRELRATVAQNNSAKSEAIRSMDPKALDEAARVGLVSEGAVDVEMKKRAARVQRSTFGTAGAVVSGFMPCLSPHCNVMTDMSKSQWCDEHRPAHPRTFITSSYQAIDLDVAEADARERVEALRRQLDDAEAEHAETQQRIKQWDAAHE